jgi:peptidoglycan/xylan/chitin deacetylase (PgdA/CDA1 family)
VTQVVRAFTFHAERLERDDVWRRTSDLLEALEARGGHATLFVDPSAAIEAEFDLGPRLLELLDRGHEVGQRTHVPEPIEGSLDRDLHYLRQRGVEPGGFVAGGWAISQEALRWLREHGFAYDASALSSEGWTAPLVQDGLLRLPTTTSLIRIAQHRGQPMIAGTLAYELGYIHDDDLIAFTRRMAAGTALRRWGDDGPLITAADLANRIRTDAAP